MSLDRLYSKSCSEILSFRLFSHFHLNIRFVKVLIQVFTYRRICEHLLGWWRRCVTVRWSRWIWWNVCAWQFGTCYAWLNVLHGHRNCLREWYRLRDFVVKLFRIRWGWLRSCLMTYGRFCINIVLFSEHVLCDLTLCGLWVLIRKLALFILFNRIGGLWRNTSVCMMRILIGEVIKWILLAGVKCC